MIVAWIGGIAAGVVLLELAARGIVRRSGRYALTPHARSEHALDAAELPGLPARVRIEVNAEGERGAEVPAQDPNLWRALVIGGSAAECYMLDQEDAWPRALERELQDEPGPLAGRTIHVGSIARSLLTCASLARMLEGVLPRYRRLDALITYAGASDVVAWMEQGAPAACRPQQVPEAELFPVGPDEPFGWRPGSLALRRVAVRLVRRLLHPVERREGVGGTVGRNRRMRAEARTLLDEVPEAAGMLAHLEEQFRLLVLRARAHGARVLVVGQPWLERAFTPEEERLLWSFGRGRPFEGPVDTYYTHRVAHELLRRANEVQFAVARELGAETLDLMGSLPMDFEHFYDDLHLTPRGAAVVGARIAEAVRALEAPSAGGA